ncbi:IclR family transcriptional regulator [Halorhabdus rudnickae]|uniref:IclR family transcriptional regulator n=1 Tax=Halorhabdus rudnickae TaxID=1775544 RepID=UPI0014382CC3|nr:IclR family transcriptional regulator [Halorhabdus rudnickae]
MGDPADSGIQSVNITLSIIKVIQQRGKARISDLAAELDYAKSTIYQHLVTLEQNQLVTREGEAFRLSLSFLEISHDVKQQQYNYSIIKETVDELAKETGEYAQFGSEEHGQLIYVYRSGGSSDINEHFDLDIKESLHCTALGKAILAFMPEEQAQTIVAEQGLERLTENTITDPDILFDELESIREKRYAVDNEEFATGLRCVAAPVIENYRYHSEVLGSIGIFGPASRLTEDRLEGELGDQVKQFANLIEIASNTG